MPLLQSLATLGRLIRRAPEPSVASLETYARQVIPIVDRAEWLYQYWLEQSSLFSDSEKLGNVAAIHRWEAATMGRTLIGIKAPAVLRNAHLGMIEALEMASRAAQMLGSGSRFHNANAVCEGQALLLASRDRRLAALKAMRHHLLPVIAPPVPEAAAAQPETLAQAAALAAASSTAPAAPMSTAAAPADDLGHDGADVHVPDDGDAHDLGDHDHDAVPAFLTASQQDADDEVHDDGPALHDPTEPPPAFLSAQPSAPTPAPPSTQERPGWGALFDQPDDQPRR